MDVLPVEDIGLVYRNDQADKQHNTPDTYNYMEKIQQSKSSLLQSCGLRIDTDHHRVERDR
ncbi:hypothetical protein OSM86_25330, partial [Escherichia coli]|nr:hypothetical protein [Escherichia coli]